MRKLARIVGVIWIALAFVAGGALIATGHIQGNRGDIFILFGATLPGIGLYQWGNGPRTTWSPAPPSQPRRQAPIITPAEAGHVLTLAQDPLELEKIEYIRTVRPIADTSAKASTPPKRE
jgi:hypothetical protein